jgi:hypothetical protein
MDLQFQQATSTPNLEEKEIELTSLHYNKKYMLKICAFKSNIRIKNYSRAKRGSKDYTSIKERCLIREQKEARIDKDSRQLSIADQYPSIFVVHR